MPTYEYLCTQCGHKFDTFQSIKAAPLTECPSCHHLTLQRVISGGTGLIFKGSGFYITDYARKSSSSAIAKPAAEKEVATKSPMVKADKKPETVKP